VATSIRAWVRHLRSRGITPDRLGLLIHDEPHEGSDAGPLVAWARAIQAAEPDVLIWVDPTYRDPAAGPAELFAACDVLCPNRPMWLQHGEPFARFYRVQQQQGRMLQLYSCAGPAKLLDPYSYHRLQAWHSWSIGGTGSFFWAFGDNGGASSWNEYNVAAGPYTPLFLDQDSVTAGKHMEAIRESVEDYETLAMLDQAIQQARHSGRADAVLREAQTVLAGADRAGGPGRSATPVAHRPRPDRGGSHSGSSPSRPGEPAAGTLAPDYSPGRRAGLHRTRLRMAHPIASVVRIGGFVRGRGRASLRKDCGRAIPCWWQ
jgi:hypothetical protein